ncbi:MAG: hypothetical protein PHH04_03710 [Thomasclavelia sp.]|jgi:hypothetical protein|nr:hypothetical protein [Thomasclavelia sp.]
MDNINVTKDFKDQVKELTLSSNGYNDSETKLSQPIEANITAVSTLVEGSNKVSSISKDLNENLKKVTTNLNTYVDENEVQDNKTASNFKSGGNA